MSARQFTSAAPASTFLGTIGLPSKLAHGPYSAVQRQRSFFGRPICASRRVVAALTNVSPILTRGRLNAAAIEEPIAADAPRSEERRVGKECRSWWAASHQR